jgi:hypothetical protein
MGITITVGGIAGIPLLVLSGPIIDKIGHANVLFIGFIFYAIRLFGKKLFVGSVSFARSIPILTINNTRQ